MAAALVGCGPGAAPATPAAEGADRSAASPLTRGPTSEAGDGRGDGSETDSRGVGPAPAPAPRPAPTPASRTVRGYSLHIGVDAYTELPRLAKAVKDATDLTEAFNELGFQATLLANPRSRSEVISAVRQIARRADQTQSVIVTFSGHGWGERLPGEAGQVQDHDFLCPATYAGPNDGVGTRELRDILNDSDALGAALLVDACRSGAALSTLASTRSFREFADSGATKVLMLYGTQAGMVSLEDSITDQFGVPIENGRFSHFILGALRRRAALDADVDGIFSFEEMADTVARDMMTLSQLDKSRYQIPFWDSQLARVKIPLDEIDAGRASASALSPGTVAHQVRQIADGAPARIGPTLAAEFAAGGRLASDADLRRQLFDALSSEITRAQAVCFRAADPGQRRAALDRLLTLVRATLDLETGSERALEGLAAGATQREMIDQIVVRLDILDGVSGVRGADRPLAEAILSNIAGAYARWLIDVGDDQTLDRLLRPARGQPRPDAVASLRDGLPRLWRTERPEVAARLFERFSGVDPTIPMPPGVFEATLRRHLAQSRCESAAEALGGVLGVDSVYLPEERQRAADLAVEWAESRLEGSAALTSGDLACLRAIGSVGGEELCSVITTALRTRLEGALASATNVGDVGAILNAGDALRAMEPGTIVVPPDRASAMAEVMVRAWPRRPGAGEVTLVRRLEAMSDCEAGALVEPVYDGALTAWLDAALADGPSAALGDAGAWVEAATSLGLDPESAQRPVTDALRRRLTALCTDVGSRASAMHVLELGSALSQRAPQDPALRAIPAGDLAFVLMGDWGTMPSGQDTAAIRSLATLVGLTPAALAEPHLADLAGTAMDDCPTALAALRCGAAWGAAGVLLGVDDGMAWAPLMDRAADLTARVAEDLGEAGSTKRRDALAALAPVLQRDGSLRPVVADAVLARGRTLVDRGDLGGAIKEFRAAVEVGADPASVDPLLIPSTVTQGAKESGEGLVRAAEHLIGLADAGWTSPATESLLADILRGSVDRAEAYPINLLVSAPATARATCVGVGALALDLIGDPEHPDAYVRLHTAWDLRALYADTARQLGVTFPLDGAGLLAALKALRPRSDEQFDRHVNLLYRAENEQLLPRTRSAEYWRSLLADTPETSGYLGHIAQQYLERRPAEEFPCELATKVIGHLLLASSGWSDAVAWFDRCGSPALSGDAALYMDRLVYLRDIVRGWKERPLAVAFLTGDGANLKPTRVDLMLGAIDGLSFTMAPVLSRWPRPQGGWSGQCAVEGKIDPEGILLNFCGEQIRVGLDHGWPAYANDDWFGTMGDGWSVRGHEGANRRILVALPPEDGMLLSTYARLTGQWTSGRAEDMATVWHDERCRVLGNDLSFDVITACHANFNQYGVGPAAADRPLRLRGAMVLSDIQRADLEENIRRGGRSAREITVEIRADGRTIQTVTATPSNHVAMIDVEIPRGTQNIGFERVSDWPNPAHILFCDLRLLGLPVTSP